MKHKQQLSKSQRRRRQRRQSVRGSAGDGQRYRRSIHGDAADRRRLAKPSRILFDAIRRRSTYRFALLLPIWGLLGSNGDFFGVFSGVRNVIVRDVMASASMGGLTIVTAVLFLVLAWLLDRRRQDARSGRRSSRPRRETGWARLLSSVIHLLQAATSDRRGPRRWPETGSVRRTAENDRSFRLKAIGRFG